MIDEDSKHELSQLWIAQRSLKVMNGHLRTSCEPKGQAIHGKNNKDWRQKPLTDD